MGSNFSSSKTKHKDKSKKGNAKIITKRKKSSYSIGKREIILPNRLKEYKVELYGSNRIKSKSMTLERLSNSLTEMVKFYEETNLKSKRNNNYLSGTSPLPSSDKEIEI
jgi:hypothetical protein